MDKLHIYPEYPRLKRDYTYSVRVFNGTEAAELPVYNDIRHANHYNSKSMHAERDKRFVSFAFEGRVTVEITVHTAFDSFVVAPSRNPVKATLTDNVIRFELDRPRHTVLRLDEDEDSMLAILADAPETEFPARAGDNVVIFNASNPAPDNIQCFATKRGQGFTLVENTTLYPDDTVFIFEAGWHDVTFMGLKGAQQLYLCPGAVLNSRVHVWPGSDGVKMFGRGLLRDGNDTRAYNSDGAFNYLLTIGSGWDGQNSSKNTVIRDVTLLDATSFSIVFLNATLCEIDNVKVLAGEISTDGFSFWGGSNHIEIHDCFLTVTDNLFVIGAGLPIDYVHCTDCLVGTSIKLFFPQGDLGPHSLYENIDVFRATMFYEPFGGYKGYLDMQNICAIDCPDSTFLKSGNNTTPDPKIFHLKNATLPDTKRSRSMKFAKESGGKPIGGYEFYLDNVWFNDRQITEVKTDPTTSHLYLEDKTEGGTKVEITYSGGYEPVKLNQYYGKVRPLRLNVHWLPVFAPEAPLVKDEVMYIDGATVAALYGYENVTCADGKLTAAGLTLTAGSDKAQTDDGEKVLSAPVFEKNGRLMVPYDAFTTLLGIGARYSKDENKLYLGRPLPTDKNLLVDYDFEDPQSLRSWTTKNFTYVVLSKEGEGRNGGTAMQYGGTTSFSYGWGEQGAYEYVLDQVLLHGPCTYRISFWAKGAEGVGENATVSAGLSWHYNANILSGNTGKLTNEWKQYTFDVPLKESELSGTKKMAMAILYNDCDRVLIDDVSMTRVD